MSQRLNSLHQALEDEVINNCNRYDFTSIMLAINTLINYQNLTLKDNVIFESNVGSNDIDCDIVSVRFSNACYYVCSNLLGIYGKHSGLLKSLNHDVYLQALENNMLFKNLLNHIQTPLFHNYVAAKVFNKKVLFDEDDFVRFSLYGFLPELKTLKLKQVMYQQVNNIVSFRGTKFLLTLVLNKIFTDAVVNIIEFSERNVNLIRQQSALLGQSVNGIGKNYMLGNQISSSHSKVVINISHIPYEQYTSYIENEDVFNELKEIIKFLINANFVIKCNFSIINNENHRVLIGSKNISLSKNTWLSAAQTTCNSNTKEHLVYSVYL